MDLFIKYVCYFMYIICKKYIKPRLNLDFEMRLC